MDGRRTFEDFFDMKKKDLKAYLKEVGLKISGNKRELTVQLVLIVNSENSTILF
jgi:hypothetical protein